MLELSLKVDQVLQAIVKCHLFDVKKCTSLMCTLIFLPDFPVPATVDGTRFIVSFLIPGSLCVSGPELPVIMERMGIM